MRHIPRLAPAVLLLTAGLVAACGGADRAAAPSPASPDTSSGAAGTSDGGLQVVYDPGDGGDPVTWTLTCDPVGGTHPDPRGACADLAAADAPFVEPDPDVACTEVYGGPQTARVTGSWRGEPVDTGFDRVDGCSIARWDAVGRLLPAAPGTALSLPA